MHEAIIDINKNKFTNIMGYFILLSLIDRTTRKKTCGNVQ